MIVRRVAQADYAEDAGGTFKPILVKVLKRDNLRGARLKAEIRALTEAIAKACRHPSENAHLFYESPAVGRVAFGGVVVE